jgi:hypothetical protein
LGVFRNKTMNALKTVEYRIQGKRKERVMEGLK